MYKYCFMICLTLVKLNACELMNGVTIQDFNVKKLFETVAELYRDDTVTNAIIENYYEQYLCLLANKGVRPLNDASIIAHLNSLVDAKKNKSGK